MIEPFDTTPSGQSARQPRSPRVAVLMTVHAGDRVEHLDEALLSIRSQTHSNVRIHVFCDGVLPRANRDTLLNRLDLASGKDTLLESDRRVGVAAGLNRVLETALHDADTEFLARMDADDVSAPTRFERQVAYLEARPDVEVVGTWCIEFMKSGVAAFKKRLPSEHDEVLKFMCLRSPVVHPSVMMRRRAFDAGLRYSPHLSVMQDYDLWTRLAMAGFRISNVPEFLLWYRLGPDFFDRRAGWTRAILEVRARARYASTMHLLRPWHPLAWMGLIALRLAPTWAKRLAYSLFR